ncbi:MAG: ATP-binding cassette domain-containing protein [Alphaproteobacteria bacterium]|nr:ATP-binding cassette domain-containing protein [Alphaproteobacteria bacterium]
MELKLRVFNVFKFFGAVPQGPIKRPGRGEAKKPVFGTTGQMVGQLVGLRQASLDAPDGKAFVMGRLGSAQSVLAHMFNRLIKPTSGQFLIDGGDLANRTPETMRAIRRDKIAMVFQHFALLPHNSEADKRSTGREMRCAA